MGDIFLTLSLINTILFIFASLISADAPGYVTRKKIEETAQLISRSENFTILGLFGLLSEVVFILFSLGWQFGVIAILVILVSFVYWLQDVAKLERKKQI